MSFALQAMISAPLAACAGAGARSFAGEARQFDDLRGRGFVINWRAYSETWRLT
jgi:hypothetical protein